MNYPKIAGEIVHYFTENKGIGHSRAVVNDAKSTRSIVAVATESEKAARVMRQTIRGHVICLADIENGCLREKPLNGFPLILDNGAVVELLTGLTAKAEKPKPARKVEFEAEPKGEE